MLVNRDKTDSRFRAKIGKPSRLSIETLGTVETQREERERTQEGGGMVQIWPCYRFCGVWFGSIVGIVEGTVDSAPLDDGIESSASIRHVSGDPVRMGSIFSFQAGGAGGGSPSHFLF